MNNEEGGGHKKPANKILFHPLKTMKLMCLVWVYNGLIK